VACLAPRAPNTIVRPRRGSGVVARPLNFTVRRREQALVAPVSSPQYQISARLVARQLSRAVRVS